MQYLSVQEARERILAHFNPVEVQTVLLASAAGRVLATDISAGINLPPFDNSAMDGFAVIAADLQNASEANPARLSVVADIPAGRPADLTIGHGQAARIMTGAAMPTGADTVVPVEETDFNDRSPGTPAPEQVAVYKTLPKGTHVRPHGSDVQKDQRVIPAGQRLRPQDLGLLAMLGEAQIPVHRLPRVALLSSGDELIPVDQPLAPGKIRDSNSYTLTALIEDCGAQTLDLGIAADRRESVQGLLNLAVTQNADLIISSAGVSVGAFDFVKDVVESNGQLDFWKVNMRPGKPVAFGSYRGIPFIGLPGNPVSAFVGFEVFVRPVIRKLSGQVVKARPRIQVRLEEPIESDGRESYLRAIVSEQDGVFSARLTGHQGSGNLLSLVQANALLIVPAGVKSLATGQEIEAWLLSEL